MSKIVMLGSAALFAASLMVSSAQAGGVNHGSTGLLGLNLNVGQVVGVKATVGGTSNHGSSSDLVGLNVQAPGLVNAKVDVGQSGHQGSSLLNANVNVGGASNNNGGGHCDFCGGYSGGVSGHDGW